MLNVKKFPFKNFNVSSVTSKHKMQNVCSKYSTYTKPAEELMSLGISNRRFCSSSMAMGDFCSPLDHKANLFHTVDDFWSVLDLKAIILYAVHDFCSVLHLKFDFWITKNK